MKARLLLPVAPVLLAACTALPIPFTVDLTGQVPQEMKTGEVLMQAGRYTDVTVFIPNDTGYAFDASSQGGRIVSAALDLDLELGHNARSASGLLHLRLVLSSRDRSRSATLFQVTWDVGQPTTRVARSFPLEEAALRILNEKAFHARLEAYTTPQNPVYLSDPTLLRYSLRKIILSGQATP